MITIFLIAFVVVLCLNLISNGEGYIYFTRLITAINNIRDKSPRYAKNKDTLIEIEYKFGRRRYGILVLKKNPLQWTQVGALKNGEWLDRTAKITYLAGPFKNFHGMGIAPKHISKKYEKLAFKFGDGTIIHVSHNDTIVPRIKAAYESIKASKE